VIARALVVVDEEAAEAGPPKKDVPADAGPPDKKKNPKIDTIKKK
jgi:hypothetical protein